MSKGIGRIGLRFRAARRQPSTSGGTPTLTNYTHQCFLTSLYLSTGGVLRRSHVRGSKVYYETRVVALASGGATSLTAVSLASFIPSNALMVHLDMQGLATTLGAATLQFASGVGSWYQTRTTTQRPPFFTGWMPNVGRRIWYARGDALDKTDIHVLGYIVPNGAE